jgi:hypothetical protein
MRRSAIPKFLALLAAKHIPVSILIQLHLLVDKQIFYFEYLKPMEDHAACETYQAKLVDPPNNIVVKSVSRYGKQVHEFLANKNYAPPVFDTTAQCPMQPPSPPRPKNAPAGLAFNFMQMVVMDYVAPCSRSRSTHRCSSTDSGCLVHSSFRRIVRIRRFAGA